MNRLSGTSVLGRVLVISGLLAIYYQLRFLYFKPTGLARAVSVFVAQFAIYPTFLRQLAFHVSTPVGVILYKLTIVWLIGVVACGIGIILLRNTARIAVLIMSSLIIGSYLGNPGLYSAKYFASTPETRTLMLITLWHMLPILLPAGYIVYLIRPDVKKLFK